MTSGQRDPREATLPTVSSSGSFETAAPAPSARLEPNGRIRDEGEISRGGMGSVHRIYDRAIGRHAAMKILDPVLARDPAIPARFATEARVTGQLQHPNIVPVHDYVTDEAGVPTHFTMQLIDGETLAQAIQRTRPRGRASADLWELLQAFLKICDAVAFAHSRGVVHCDLKPDNVMLGPYGQVYVMDWGVAHVRPGDATAVPVTIDRESIAAVGSVIGGTAQYMAPEQAQGRVADVDARTDVYALGGILYTMLTGRPPHDGETQDDALAQAREGFVRDPAEAAGNVPLADALCRIAMQALSAEPAHRYPSVARLKRDVEAVLRGGLWFGTQTFPAGKTILAEGDDAEAAYILVMGHCEVLGTVDGVVAPVRRIGPGEVFGEMGIVTSSPRTATVVAIDDVTAIVIPQAALARELETGSWLGALVRTLVERFREIESRAGTPLP
jgi:serine/threonine-protein kinase